MNNIINMIPVIKVFGVGGGGTNAINYAISQELEGAELFCLNTDMQSLGSVLGCKPENLIQLGAKLTNGLGAGSKPTIGMLAAEESIESIRKAVAGSDMIFIAAGLGGGTGTGSAPVIAKVAKSMGILTVAVVTKPFLFEGVKRMTLALNGIRELTKYVDSIIVIPNQKLLDGKDKKMNLLTAFESVNDVLYSAISGTSDLILKDGLINVDFADVNTVMREKGLAIMGTGQGSGKDRAMDAVLKATSSPLLDDIDIKNASGLIVSIVSGMDLQLEELDIIGKTLSAMTSENAIIKIGNTFDLDMNDEIKITVIATGLKNKNEQESEPLHPIHPQENKQPNILEKKTEIQKKPKLEIPAFLTRPSN